MANNRQIGFLKKMMGVPVFVLLPCTRQEVNIKNVPSLVMSVLHIIHIIVTQISELVPLSDSKTWGCRTGTGLWMILMMTVPLFISNDLLW